MINIIYVVASANIKHRHKWLINVLNVPKPTVTSTYIRQHQNVIHKLQPNGFTRVTVRILPLVSQDAILFAISFGNYKISHTIVIIIAMVNNVRIILIYCLIFCLHLVQFYKRTCVKLLIFQQLLFHHINCTSNISTGALD